MYSKKNFLRAAVIGAVGVGLVGNASAAVQTSSGDIGPQPLFGVNQTYSDVYTLLSSFQNAVGNKALYVAIYSSNTAGTVNSSVVTNQEDLRASSEALIDLASARITEVTSTGASSGSSKDLFDPRGQGANAGGVAGKLGIWGKARFDRILDDTKGGKWDGKLYSFAIGGDWKFTDRFMAGLAVSYAKLDGTTDFNKGKIDDYSYGVMPYVGFKAHDMVDLELVAGYNQAKRKRTRTQTLTDATTRIVRGNPKSDRYFVAPKIKLHKAFNMLHAGFDVGYVWANDKQKAFKESQGATYKSFTTRLNRITTRLQGGYMVNDMIMPYLFGAYAHDFTLTKHGLSRETALFPEYKNPEQHRGKNTYGGGLGIRLMAKENWSGGFEYEFKKRKDVKAHALMLDVRYQF